MLHDIGKIGIPDAILLKQGALNEVEWQEMRTHPEKGYRIVAQIPGMEEAAEIVLSHEERFDGTGYPRGLRGQQIPLGARLFALIDAMDAMTSLRERVAAKCVQSSDTPISHQVNFDERN